MKRNKSGRDFSREFKLGAVTRMLSGESPSALVRELGVRRKLLYEWKKRVEEGGEQNLRSRGRPSRAAGGVVEAAARSEQRRIAELERLVGKQQALIDFFERALQQVAAATAGKAPSTKPSASNENEPGRS
jgi:transposase-like protein